jgi:5,10-methylene-tetrahydrofolate dehydrogenase/Methenyl tetrahydrofolate cyclohydrolase
MTLIIDGKNEAKGIREGLKVIIEECKSIFQGVPGLTVILVGEDPASKIYVKNKEKFAKEIGIRSDVIKYPANIEEETLLNKINELNKDHRVSGILVQLPLPKHIDKRKVIEAIDHRKDEMVFIL